MTSPEPQQSARPEKKAENIIAIDVSSQLALTGHSSSPRRPTNAVSVRSSTRSRSACGWLALPLRREGGRDDRRVLIDSGDVVVHIQHQEERAFYQLERLWRDCLTVELGPDEPVSAPAGVRAATLLTDWLCRPG
ncbi:MAG: RsfS/YbeB/iojap family protein [Austwickia sp.]|nr:RsfS/YbeB/iojap family protein [Austwickia sp.]